ncbi:MAG: hypothetical protein IPN52_08955 [Micrococcales bacterium]|nr:hypothetical protein [Micrococcales bacterium]
MRAVPGGVGAGGVFGPLRSCHKTHGFRAGSQIPIALDPQQSALGVSDRDYVSTGGGRIGEQGPDHRHGPIERREVAGLLEFACIPHQRRSIGLRIHAFAHAALPRLDDQ